MIKMAMRFLVFSFCVVVVLLLWDGFIKRQIFCRSEVELARHFLLTNDLIREKYGNSIVAELTQKRGHIHTVGESNTGFYCFRVNGETEPVDVCVSWRSVKDGECFEVVSVNGPDFLWPREKNQSTIPYQPPIDKVEALKYYE